MSRGGMLSLKKPGRTHHLSDWIYIIIIYFNGLSLLSQRGNLGKILTDVRDDKKNNALPQNASGAKNSQGEDGLIPAHMSNLAVNSAESIWHAVQGELRTKLGERVHKSWTGQLSFQSENEASVALTAPSRFVAGRIDSKYGELVRTLWAGHDIRDVEICAATEVKASKPGATHVQSLATSPKTNTAPDITPHEQAIASTPIQTRRENENNRGRFTFENFVVGPSNELAYAVARRIASSNECLYNPVLIYGPHGMGKTHLLYAIKQAAIEQNPGRRVKLISAENFVANFVQSVRSQGRTAIEAFKTSLRDVDMLIIDDAHFIADKPGSQEELLHTLIALVDDGKQILLATDRHPHAIDRASERLKSYLCGGLLCDITSCDYELRLRILDRLIERRRKNGYPSLAMPQNARDHLAARINATPRDLEGAFSQVVARLEFLGKPLTLESVQDALAHSRYNSNSRPTVDKIQKACAKEFNISMDEILSKRRARAIARPRQVAMYLSKQLTTRSLPDIGRRFGGRDHTTVIHAVKRIEALRKTDPALNTSVESVIETLKG